VRSSMAPSTELYERYAELYDLAFSWDVEEEVDWLLERLGPECRSVLEPGCGSGRVLEALARRRLEVVGVDRSPAMVELARARGLEVVRADMTDFDLGRAFDGAVCPIGTLAHLSPEELGRHLERMGRHLRPGARYLVQLQLGGEAYTSEWELNGLRIVWATERFDLAAGRQRQRSRIELPSGEVVEEVHEMTLWTPAAWAAAVAASPFVQTGLYDGAEDGYPAVEPGSEGALLWHELTRQDDQAGAAVRDPSARGA
jgi:SAM-dependent methyltransferase